MKVFVSWSGPVARDVASAVAKYVQLMVPGIRCFVSADEVEKGARWSTSIAQELEQTNFGILILNRQNISAPWLYFEAGALSKSLETGRVVPVLFGLEVGEISSTPLSQFQCTFFVREEFKKLCAELAKAIQGQASDSYLTYFEKFWPDLESEVAASSDQLRIATPEKEPTEQALRDIYRRLNTISSRLSEPQNILPVETVARALLIANDKAGSAAKMSDQLEVAERILEEIRDEIIYLDQDSIDDVRSFVEKVVDSVEDFKTLEEKERAAQKAGGLFD